MTLSSVLAISYDIDMCSKAFHSGGVYDNVCDTVGVCMTMYVTQWGCV